MRFKRPVISGTEFLICLSVLVFMSIIFSPLQANAVVNHLNFTASNIVYQSAIGNNGATVGYTVTTIPASTISCNPLSGALFPIGNTPVICSATGSQGTENISFIISVNGTDSTPPNIIPPANVTATKSGTLTIVPLGNATVSDNADLSPLVTNDHPIAGFPNGTTFVTWTATDHSGNSKTAIQKVTISPLLPLSVTATPPGRVLPYKTVQNVILSSSDPTNIYYTIDGNTPTNSSAIYKNPISVNSNMTLKFFGVYSNGTAGPVTTASYTIDTIAPVITRNGPSPFTVQQGSSYSDAGATATDNVDGNVTSSIIKSNPVNTSIIGTYPVTYNVSDQAGNAAAQVTRVVKVVGTGTTTTIMSDTIASGGQPLYSADQIRAEYVSSTSSLVGKNMSSIQLQLKKSAVPTGTAIIGVFNTDLSVKKVFGTVDVSTLTTSSVDYTFSLPAGQTYQIVSGDRIGIKFTGGDGTNKVSVMTDKTNAFDGTNSYRTSYTTKWVNTQTEDLYMTLKVSVASASGDTTPPVITLTGSPTVTVQQGLPYSDTGATATDNLDGNVTSSIVTSNPVNTSIIGTYPVTYNVSDQAGNAAAQVTRTVKVVDTIAPTVSAAPPGNLYNSIQSVILTASEPSTIYYTMDGSTPTISSHVYNGPVSINSDKTFKFFAKDIAGNSGSVAPPVSYAIDTLSPVITLRGPPEVPAEVFSTYVDAGATANDNRDGNITSSIITGGLPINTSILGTHIVTYTVSDQAGNAAAQVTRVVNVQDTTPPVITLRGSSTVTVQHGSPYNELGATATDNLDGNITSSIVIGGPPVDTSVLSGTFTVTYDVSDNAGNAAATVTRTVNVLPATDTTPPTLSIVSPSNNTSTSTPIVLVSGTASDNISVQSVTWKVDSGLVSTASGTANWSFTTASLPLGGHTIWVNATDQSGNVATQNIGITITSDTTPPTLSIASPSNNTSTIIPTVPVSGTASDTGSGVSAVTWKVDSGSVSTASGTANWSFTTASLTAGTHTIWVNATDQSGNVATQNIGITITTAPIMDDTVASTGLSTWSGRPIHAENASSTSVLVGKNMNSILVKLKKSGAPTGNVTIGVFDINLNVVKQFGNKTASTIATSYTYYNFSLPVGQTYQIVAGDKIGIKYSGGDAATNFISIMRDTTNAFDGTNSYHTYYTTKWNYPAPTDDLTMTLK